MGAEGQDLHESQVIAAVESMASCILSVSPPPLRHPVLQASHLQHPDGRFEVVIKRRNGEARFRVFGYLSKSPVYPR